MKMKPEDFARLVSDMRTVADSIRPEQGRALMVQRIRELNMVTLWEIWHAVNFDRSNPDTHPAYTAGRPRRLPAHNPPHEYDPYNGDLNDSHIATAIRAAAPQLGITA